MILLVAYSLEHYSMQNFSLPIVIGNVHGLHLGSLNDNYPIIARLCCIPQSSKLHSFHGWCQKCNFSFHTYLALITKGQNLSHNSSGIFCHFSCGVVVKRFKQGRENWNHLANDWSHLVKPLMPLKRKPHRGKLKRNFQVVKKLVHICFQSCT